MAKLTLDGLVAQVQAAFGDDLVSVVLYGSAAGGDHNPKRSDQNVLVIVRRVPMTAAKAVSAAARAWGEAGNPPPLVMTEDEWRGSADIFPMEYADIIDRHRVLVGTSPVTGIRVQTSDLRLQLEHEAMGKLLKLRQAVLASAGDDRALADLVAASTSGVMVLFRAVCRLHGQTPEATNDKLVDQVAALASLDPAPFHRAVRSARGSGVVKKGDALATVGGHLAGVGQLVSHLDQFGDGSKLPG